MTKSQLINIIAKKAHLTKKASEDAVVQHENGIDFSALGGPFAHCGFYEYGEFLMPAGVIGR